MALPDDAWIAGEVAICKKASEGTLEVILGADSVWRVVVRDRPGGIGVIVMETNYEADARFFAAARNGYPEALKALRRATVALDEIKRVCGNVYSDSRRARTLPRDLSYATWDMAKEL